MYIMSSQVAIQRLSSGVKNDPHLVWLFCKAYSMNCRFCVTPLVLLQSILLPPVPPSVLEFGTLFSDHLTTDKTYFDGERFNEMLESQILESNFMESPENSALKKKMAEWCRTLRNVTLNNYLFTTWMSKNTNVGFQFRSIVKNPAFTSYLLFLHPLNPSLLPSPTSFHSTISPLHPSLLPSSARSLLPSGSSTSGADHLLLPPGLFSLPFTLSPLAFSHPPQQSQGVDGKLPS